MNLFKAETSSTDVRTDAKYDFWFDGVGTSADESLTLKKDETVFRILFPGEYVLSPASMAPSTTQEYDAGSCHLYETEYMSGEYSVSDD